MNVDIAEFVSDYWQMLKDNDEPIPPRTRLIKDIQESLADHEVTASTSLIDYYLPARLA
jgi:hypothetical protein